MKPEFYIWIIKEFIHLLTSPVFFGVRVLEELKSLVSSLKSYSVPTLFARCAPPFILRACASRAHF